MKKYLAILLLCTATSFVANAQTTDSTTAAVKKISMKEEVGLTSEQDTQIKAIKEEYKGKVTAMEANPALDEKAKKAQKKEIMAERESKINALLSKEQQDKYLEYKAKMKAQKEAEQGKN
jgi:hypothetical protein